MWLPIQWSVRGTRTRLWLVVNCLALAVAATAPAAARAAPESPPYERHLLETQLGGGPAVGAEGLGGIVQGQARFALWHTIGLGLYGGGMILGSDAESIVPLTGRLNLSLPFWTAFEPVGSIGIGPYFWTSRGETVLGAHGALGLLFPGRKFGIELIAHVTDDPRVSSELTGFLTLAVTALYR